MRARLDHWPASKRVAALVVASAVLTGLFVALRLPAAFLIGPMIAAGALSISGATVNLPKWPLYAAQAIVGAMIAGSFPAEAFGEMVRDWPLILFGTVATVAASMAIGILLTRAGVMPGTTAIWGSAPGAASVMTFMSADYGADMRLVALMQYLRVAMCVLLATIVARVMGAPTSATVMAVFPPAPWQAHAATLALTLLAGWLAYRGQGGESYSEQEGNQSEKSGGHRGRSIAEGARRWRRRRPPSPEFVQRLHGSRSDFAGVGRGVEAAPVG